MQSSTVLKQAQDILDEVLLIIRRESEDFNPVLTETERAELARNEERLRKHIQKTMESESESNLSWRSWLGLTSPQARIANKCLEDARELLQRIKGVVNAKVRDVASGKSNTFVSSGHEATPERDTEPPPTDDDHGLANMIVISPLNMGSLSKPSPSNANLAAQHDYDHHYMYDLNEAINTPLNMSIDAANVFSGQYQRGPLSPPSPPVRPRAHPGDSHLSSETMSDPDSSRSRSTRRRPPPPPPRSAARPLSRRLPSNTPSPARGPLSPDPTMASSISQLTQHVDALVSSLVRESSSGRAHGQRGTRRSDYRNNCLEISGSTVEGLTMNNGGSCNSGAVIHKMPPAYLPRHVPQF